MQRKLTERLDNVNFDGISVRFDAPMVTNHELNGVLISAENLCANKWALSAGIGAFVKRNILLWFESKLCQGRAASPFQEISINRRVSDQDRFRPSRTNLKPKDRFEGT